jgi:virginiamycin B lyase
MYRMTSVLAGAAVVLAVAGCGASGPPPSASPGSLASPGTPGSLASSASPPARSATAVPAGSPGAAASVGQVLAQIHVGGYPDGITAGFGSLWTANLNSGSVSRIDPASRRVTATIAVPPGPISLLAADGAIWAAGYNGTTVSRIDPARDRVTATIRVGAKPVSLVLARGSIWAFNQGDRTVSVVNLRSMKVTRTIRTDVIAGFASAGAGLIWVPDFQGASNEVLGLSPRTGQAIRKVRAGAQPVNVTFGSGSGWTGNGPDDTVTRFDPASGGVQHTIRTPADAGNVLADGRAVWVTSYLGNELVQISAGTDSVVGAVSLGSEPNGIVTLDGYLWVTESGADEVAVVRPAG